VTACYAWPVTVLADSDLRLHVSTEHARFSVRLFRYGAEVVEVDSQAGVLTGMDLPLGRPDEAWGWPAYPIALGADLQDGVYIAIPVPLRSDGTPESVQAEPALANRKDASLFVLRRYAPGGPRARTIWYKLPTATYTAYNQIGGASLYANPQWARDWMAQGYVGSLQRPGNGGVGGRVMEGDAPDAYVRTSRRQTFAHWDAPFVVWLEQHGYQVSYCTDYDLQYDENLLAGDGLLISGGHDEYWSWPMRDRLLQFVDRGGNVCFFTGDTACFEVEFAPSGDRLFCRKMSGGSPDGSGSARMGALWPVNDPGDWLTMSSPAWGGGWWDGRRAIVGYQAVVDTHWAFDGVEFPAGGITGGESTPVIGYETDGVRLWRESDPPRLGEYRKGLGPGRVLLAIGRLPAGWVAGYDEANAAMMLRTASSGGMVFSVGTTDWPLALQTDPGIGQITANVVSRLQDRALRIHGPVCPETEYVGEGDMVGPDREVTWYIDGDQVAELGLTDIQWQVRGGRQTRGSAAQLVTQSGENDVWLTVTATARDNDRHGYFGSRTVRVLDSDEFLRRRLVRTLNSIAFPDEQGGALVDQHATEGELADRVIPVRIAWINAHLTALHDLLDDLAARWTADGRMADATLREDEK
jgi:hypothetical protein